MRASTLILALAACLLSTDAVSAESLSASGNGENPNSAADPSKKASAYMIPVEGEIKELLFTTVKRRTEEAMAGGARLIMLRINSPGGELQAAMDLSNYVFNLPKDVTTVAFVQEKAYSAAALLSVACDRIYMQHGSAIGDCQPIMPGPEGYKVVGEKIQTVLRERFRTFAKAHGYNELLAEAFVTAELDIIALQETASGNMVIMERENWDIKSDTDKGLHRTLRVVKGKGKLPTFGDLEAMEMGFSRGSFKDAAECLASLGYRDVPVAELTRTETVLDFFDSWSAILLMAAIFFGYMEMKTGGLGIFGSIAAVCLAGFFVGKYYTGQANYMEILLLFIGLGLLALEIFVFPGFGLTGVVGAAVILMALILSMQDFVIPRGEHDFRLLYHNLAVICGAFLGATVVFFVMLALFPRLEFALLPGLILGKPRKETPAKGRDPDVESLVGRSGVTVTPLRPCGKARIGDEVIQVVAKGDWMDEGAAVKVCEHEGNRIVVKTIEKEM